jgi:hypothetical protein
MMYKAKAAVSSEIRTKHSKQSEHHAEFIDVKPGGTLKKPLRFKRFIKSAVFAKRRNFCSSDTY